ELRHHDGARAFTGERDLLRPVTGERVGSRLAPHGYSQDSAAMTSGYLVQQSSGRQIRDDEFAGSAWQQVIGYQRQDPFFRSGGSILGGQGHAIGIHIEQKTGVRSEGPH